MPAADESSSKSKRSRPHGAPADNTRLPKKRRSPNEAQRQPSDPARKPGPAPKPLPLSTFHEAALAELRPKYDVLVASVISSTKIRTRVERIVEHLRRPDARQDAASRGGGGAGAGDVVPMAPLVLLHARPAEVCKMITVAETGKAALAGGDGAGVVYQYNHLFEPPCRPAESTSVDETVLGGGRGAAASDGEVEDGESDDGFEKLEIFDRAANPKGEARPQRSMGIFLSRVPVPELKSRAGVTVQTAGVPADGG